MRIRLGEGFWSSRVGLGLLGLCLLLVLCGIGVFTYYWISFAKMIDERLAGHTSQNAALVYAAPERIFVGEKIDANELASYLQRVGYTERHTYGAPGEYEVSHGEVVVRPSPTSFFEGKNALTVEFGSREIREIRSLNNGAPLGSAELEPELITNLFDQTREKRRPVRFADIPKVLLDAVLSAEDKRFFEHPGFDPLRILGAALTDLRRGSKAQGASTITMQLARSFFFSTQRTWRRKIAETLVSLQLEHRFSKQQIFELYANEIYLGNRGSFAIHGFGEAALAYFNKDIRDLNLSEAAFLAGIIRAPNRYSSADRRPERAAEARDRVLEQMVENEVISAAAAREARRTPLHLVGGALGMNAAPYFVDMVKDHLLDRFSEAEVLSGNLRVYTTLDPDMQRFAVEAVNLGMKNVDTLLARKYARWKKAKQPVPQAQVALVAMNPHTGEILALMGGRDYGQSQLNRVLARRQPGSAFKPFVYAAAFDDAVDGTQPVVTPATTVVDEPTTFEFEGKQYTPNNYGEQFHGTVTLRDALTYSLNVATVKVAELIGYGRVVQVTRQLGLDPNIQATPAMALGAYEMTPLEVAAGYTAFANGGTRAEPLFIREVERTDGKVLELQDVRTRQVLDPRVAYLVTNVLEDVMNRGTGAAARAHGFVGPAAGKTGTSHDGWFVGYTSNLLCVVWVGFDDNRDLGLSGTAAAAPIWAEFMKRAVSLPAYHDLQPFTPPDGVVTVAIDPETLQLATPMCPVTREEVFIAGTEPSEFCAKHGGQMITQVPPVSWLSRVFGGKPKPPTQPATGAAPAAGKTAGQPPQSPTSAEPAAPGQAPTASEDKKKGLLKRIFGIFGNGKKDKEQEQPKKGPGGP